MSDAKLKRDLKGRTIQDVYRENAAGRRADRVSPAIRTADEYLAFMREKIGPHFEPHPASIDPDHPANIHRLKMPRRETVKE